MTARRSNSVRIIGGEFRRRLLHFPDLPGLRPTPDRVRETLFNWLGQRLDGQTCLDAFAGSGALGFEAASRGAAKVVMLEQDGRALEALRRNVEELGAKNVDIVRADALAWLRNRTERFDLVLLDPPFEAGLLEPALRLAATGLNSGGRIYAEGPRDLSCEGLVVTRSGRSGRSHYSLMEPA